MQTDLVLSSFDADMDDVRSTAQVADAGGFGTIWTYDHFAGAVVGAHWSRDPWVTLGAVAALTHRVGVGVLVANMMNRHPAQLASAVNTLQALAPGRVHLGLGAGAAPGSRFAVEQQAIGRSLEPSAARRERLVETIECLRAVWCGEAYEGRHVRVDRALDVVDDAASLPPILLGGSGEQMVRLAAAHADGVNLRAGPDLVALVALSRELTSDRPFDVSVFVDFDPEHALGGDPEPFRALGIDRRTLAVKAPFPIVAIAGVAGRLGQTV